jgi:hypothetical protein
MKDTISTKSAASTEGITIDKVRATMTDLMQRRFDFLAGLPVMQDPTGMMVPDDGYIVIVGKKVWEALKREK